MPDLQVLDALQPRPEAKRANGGRPSSSRMELTRIHETGAGDCWHKIPEGNCAAVFVGDVSDKKLWGGKRVARFKIVDGPHAGVVLRWYAQTPKKPGGRSKLAITYNAITGRKPPRDIATMKLDRWLSRDVIFEIEVKYTGRDGKGIKTTDDTRYSIVSNVIRPLTETRR